MIGVKHKGSFENVEGFFKKIKAKMLFNRLSDYAQEGVDALSLATPRDTGVTASSWSYEIRDEGGYIRVYWKNDNKTKTGIPIVILLQYGHGTGTGGYVKGRDFINPAIQPTFDKIAEKIWEEITKL